MDRQGSLDPRTVEHGQRRSRTAILAYGFRPFFLLAGLHAGLAIPAWMLLLHGVTVPGAPLPALAWHAHEMIYGFVLAAMAGFLLTAIPSWTGRRGFAGPPLLALVLIWIAGRVAVTVPLGLPAAVIAAVDLAFIPALVGALAPSLVRSGNRRNLVFLGLLALLFTANLRFHLAGAVAVSPLLLAVDTVLVMVALVGGRIVPAFTSAGLKLIGREARIARHGPLDAAALAGTMLVLVSDVLAPGTALAGWSAAAAAVLLALRLARWEGHHTFGVPLIWVLHVAYAWLPLGLGLKAAWLLFGFTPGATWVHGITIGAFATMIVAVMSRAALGHTGRPLVASRAVTVAYALLTGAALMRVFAPSVVPGTAMLGLVGAASLWTLAFGLFVGTYAPILWRPRIDGRPG